MRKRSHSRLMPRASCLRGRVVVFRPGALGDTLLTSEALLWLRSAAPTPTIELVGNQPAGELLAAAGVVDVVTSFEAPRVTSLFLDRPVVAADWRAAELVVLWLRAAGSIASAFRASGVSRVVLADPDPPSGIHIADHLTRTLLAAGLGGPPWADRRWPLLRSARPPSTDAAPVLLHPGSGSPRKNWPAERFAAVAALLVERAHPVVVLRGPADQAAVDAVCDLLNRRHGMAIPVAAPPALRELGGVLAGARLVVGNDSGVTHLAAAMGVPTVAIFGPTDSAQWAPRGPRVTVIDASPEWPTIEAVIAAADDLLEARETLMLESSPPRG